MPPVELPWHIREPWLVGDNAGYWDNVSPITFGLLSVTQLGLATFAATRLQASVAGEAADSQLDRPFMDSVNSVL